MDITNKTRAPISVPLPGGKKLFLGPEKTGQITPKAAESPAVVALIEEGKLELGEAKRRKGSGSGGASKTQRGWSGGGGGRENIRRSGDR